MDKTCSKCGQVKAYNFFSPQPQSKDGRSSWCKSCKASHEAAKRLLRGVPAKRKPLVTDDGKQCLICNDILPLTSFPPSRRGKLGLGSYCRKCNKKYHRNPAWKERRRQYTREYRKRHRDRWLFLHRCNMLKRRARKRSVDTGEVTNAFLETLYDQPICHYCHKETDRSLRSVDHVVPISKGGIHHPSNLVMACQSCNSAKRDKSLERFLSDSGQNNSGLAECGGKQIDHVRMHIPKDGAFGGHDAS